ncbi:MAG: YhbY family RNA-binding protein [Deltaproteobacteria bacterium]|nr:YhbY family RNA-binding protein [Deltaproteobacteria bacterium]
MKRPENLTGKQRRQLKGLAHGLKPLVQISGKGITDTVLSAIDQALTDHELIKVKLSEGCPVPRKEAGPLLADPTDAHQIGLIGRVIILYRRHPDAPVVPLHS